MLSSQESFNKINDEVFEKILQYDCTYLNELIIFLQNVFNKDIDLDTKHQKFQGIIKNIHFQLINIIVDKKHLTDYQHFLPRILYLTLCLAQQNIVQIESEENKLIVPTKINEINVNGVHIVHFVSLEKQLELSSEKYDKYCLQIYSGALKCLLHKKQVNFVIDSIESICDLCYRHTEVNLEALKLLTECMPFITKGQWKVSSQFIYRVLMSQINHHLPSIHDQCILLFKQCLDLEDLDYILNILINEISWSLRIKYYMLTAVASKYGIKKILEKCDVLSTSMWKCLDEPYLLSPCIGLYKTFIKDLSEDDFLNLVMLPIIDYLTTTNNNISDLTKYNFVTYLLPEMKCQHTNSLLVLYEQMHSQLKPDLYLQIAVLRMIYNHNTEVKNCHEILDLSLKSSDSKIRSEAFTMLCSSKITPKILNLIYDFIVDNVNSDSTTLRIKLISRLENMLQKCKKLNNLIIQFSNRLHVFVLTNLTPGLNYQRKITSLKIYSILLKFYKNKDYVSHSCRNLLFTNLLDSEDIRKKCSEILVLYFIVNEEDKTYLNNWIKLGLKLCYDPLFFKNESGSTIVYTITTLIYKSNLTLDILDIRNLSMSSYVLDLAQKQVIMLKNNFVGNVTHGTLYGLLDILNSLSFERNCPEQNKLSAIEIKTMLNLIEDNLILLLDTLASKMDDEGKMEAPSFAQMDNALSSLRTSTQDKSQVPTNQFLLNFIWINIKICCDVASKYSIMLANNNILDNQYKNTQIKKCADMIADVLIRCRHKGAMEATCRSLGALIKNWKESQNWCQQMLTDHLSCMKPEDEISRRSAGVRYLIHAIVTNNKNTVKSCITQLFNIAKDNECIDNDTIVELPQAKAQHLLTAIVSNASISTDSLYCVMEDLIMLCIDKLNSPLWSIRNAALQFFSSLQARLIGQNRLNNDSWLSHLPLEPLLYHFPKLMQRLQLLWSQTSSKLSSQARLIPLVSLLKGVKLQSWTLLSPEHQQFLIILQSNLWSTGFNLEIYTVRNMAAQAYANTVQINKLSYTLNLIGNEIVKCYGVMTCPEFKGFNHLHGLMSLYKYLKNVYFMEFDREYQVFEIDHKHLPPLCKSLYISMNYEVSGPLPTKITFCHLNVKNLMIENDITKSSNLFDLVERYMSADKHTALSFLKCFKSSNKSNKNTLIYKLVNTLDVNDTDIFREIMMNIDVLLNEKHKSIKVEVEVNYFSVILKKAMSCSEKDFVTMLPVLSWLCPSEVLSTLLPFVCKYIDCNLYDSFDRCRSSESLYYFTNLKDNVCVWNTVVELLQDEDTDVRVEVTRFVNCICYGQSSMLNPYLCLRKMFEMETICSIMNSNLAFTCFWNLLSKIEPCVELEETVNPFFNEQSNVYQEQSNIIKLAYNGLTCLIDSSKNLNYYKELVKMSSETLKTECDFKGTFLNKDLMILDLYSSIHFTKLHYKREILILLNIRDDLSLFSTVNKFNNLPI